MKNNTLTAKEWLEKELNKEEYLHCHNKTIVSMEGCNEFMEKYANYKNRILEDRIKEFREIFAKDCDDMGELPFRYENKDYFLDQYNKHFNIENKQ